jgi:multidrug efflux pump subunit AcrB
MTSTTIPFQQFGFVLAYTIVLALLAAVLVLPSMLVLWDRWHRNRGDETLDADVVSAAMQLDD